ncbi:MAG: ABC transporter ATP-binding protein [Candidatus Uhrbacteria bacterium]
MAPEKRKVNIFELIPRYKGLILLMLGLSVASNAIALSLPRLVANGIDAYSTGAFDPTATLWTFGILVIVIMVLSYGVSALQAYVGETVARDMRQSVADKISRQTFAFVQQVGSSKLLTNLTSDMDSVKMFISMAVVSLVSSVFFTLGASALLIVTDWKLGLCVLTLVPAVGFLFYTVFSKVGVLFRASRKVIDRLNRTINESILGAALVRVLNARSQEEVKFHEVNTEAQDNGLAILRIFSSMIPIMTFISSMATLVILGYGGHFVIIGEMTLGQLSAFNSYLSMLIFPIMMIGFMSNAISRASASYERVVEVLDAPVLSEGGDVKATLRGDIELKHVSLVVGEKAILKDVSFALKAHSRTAIIGPTAAGKTQLLYALTGLVEPTSGEILVDGRLLATYDRQSLHAQLGLVFQDSIIFNLTIRENIKFGQQISDEAFKKAIETAELDDFIASLPDGLDTRVSERGTSLSGGQKQRVMLARALAINPTILLLDDFTARVDSNTEHRILANVAKNYPDLTLVSVTQKIASVEEYDRIILLMEGEVLAQGTHQELMETSPEYVQIFESQRSTERYES